MQPKLLRVDPSHERCPVSRASEADDSDDCVFPAFAKPHFFCRQWRLILPRSRLPYLHRPLRLPYIYAAFLISQRPLSCPLPHKQGCATDHSLRLFPTFSMPTVWRTTACPRVYWARCNSRRSDESSTAPRRLLQRCPNHETDHTSDV